MCNSPRVVAGVKPSQCLKLSGTSLCVLSAISPDYPQPCKSKKEDQPHCGKVETISQFGQTEIGKTIACQSNCLSREQVAPLDDDLGVWDREMDDHAVLNPPTDLLDSGEFSQVDVELL